MKAYDTSIRICQVARESAEKRYNQAMEEIRAELGTANAEERSRLLVKLRNLESEMRNGKMTPTPKVQEAPKGGAKA